MRTSNDVRAPMLDGIVPIKELYPISRYLSEVMSPMVDGILPAMSFDPTEKFVMLLKSPISDGSDPTKLKAIRSIDRTLVLVDVADKSPHVTP